MPLFKRSYNPLSFLRLFSLVAMLALLQGCDAVLLFPAGDISVQQRNLIIISTGLMLLIILPVIILTLIFAWRYRASNPNATYHPEWDHSTLLELLIWSAPLLIIIALGALTWVSTHKLDPYRPIERISASQALPARTPSPPADNPLAAAAVSPLTIAVVAMDWKWLFIYPEQGIATVNELAAPINRPLKFIITSTTMMNSFFIPALAGQIYAMPGMQTQLHAVINRPGTYEGFSANYSGAGFSDMHFKFYGMNREDFDHWVQRAKQGENASQKKGDPSQENALTRATYLKLEQPSIREPVRRYAQVAPDLYEAILNRCVEPNRMCISEMMAIDTKGGLGVPGAYNIVSNHSPRLRLDLSDIPARDYVGAICAPTNPLP